MTWLGRIAGIGRRGGCVRLLALIFVSLYAASSAAQAIELRCIEASRYKHLYRIFGDQNRMAAFFGVNASQLPNPETCRAALLIEGVEKMKREGGDDFDMLLNMVRSSNGWLSTLYLGSPGGNVRTGLFLGQTTRLFWLTTTTVEGTTFDYVPDFFAVPGRPMTEADVPSDLLPGWRAYVAAMGPTSRVDIAREGGKPRRCVSACTFIHAAGVERSGRAFFHRARRSAPTDPNEPQEPRSISEMADGLMETEARIVAYYRRMDTGESAVSAYLSTATQRTLAAYLLPMPRYLEDHFRGTCRPARRARAGAETIMSVGVPDGAMRLSNAENPVNDPKTTAPIEPSAPIAQSGPRDAQVTRCIVAAHTRERLAQYAKLCGNGCSRQDIGQDILRRINALVPSSEPNSQREPRRPAAQPNPQPQRSAPPPSYPPQGAPPRNYPPQAGPPPASYPPQQYPGAPPPPYQQSGNPQRGNPQGAPPPAYVPPGQQPSYR
ncbi:hypothetical protein GJW-30_1_02602 [Variibacter gotjawalensis]|uniref:Uncharacterized protein n=1 Tax=Variibacter gotjawalensis TaxID=1333996 RepID=A0A0S3PVZ4_9BRAD|nr:hypothetical protein [Variibacter gotjawalensis]NIK45892.1 hypothetical protein [Variibacter gotjawalensis]RZS47813.1 hypothetical protein EV661_0206 [Variibacter gotjawalensis]BAT60067.1 hypothetical protein GJW-30_1_02602 [Variibacter gotjawalensis]